MADDEDYLSAEDLAGIFGTEVGGASGDLARDIADLFVDDEAPVDTSAAAFDDPEPQEPPRQEGVSEADWRASAEYEDFKEQVIARHLAKKQAEEAEAARVSEEDQLAAVERARLEQERRKAEALERQAGQGPGVSAPVAARIIQGPGAKSPLASKSGSLPPAPPVPSRMIPPAPPVPQRKVPGAASTDDARLGKPLPVSEDQKEERFRAYLKELKNKMAKGDLELRSRSAVPKAAVEGEAIQLGIDAAKIVASMFEGLRIELIRNVTDVVGRKAAQAVMKKTLAKALKAHHEVFGRAGMDTKGELKLDGQLDEDRLARSIYGLPPETRLARTRKAFHDLNEMRLIALELGLGHQAKAKATSNALNSLEANFTRKAYPPVLIKWFFDEAIPSTSLAEGDSDRF